MTNATLQMRRDPATGHVKFIIPAETIRREQLAYLSAMREHLHERIAKIEEKVFGRVARRKVPRSWARWIWYMHRRLSAIERLCVADRVELDVDALAERIMRPEIARGLVRLLLGAAAG